MKPIRKVLVGTDFSETSDRALDYALRLVDMSGGTLVVLHACEVPVVAASAEQIATAGDLMGTVTRAAQAALEHRREIATSRGAKVETILREGPPAATLVDVARELRCDLVVVGTHGRRGLERAFLGSVAEQVVRRSEAPVVTVRG